MPRHPLYLSVPKCNLFNKYILFNKITYYLLQPYLILFLEEVVVKHITGIKNTTGKIKMTPTPLPSTTTSVQAPGKRSVERKAGAFFLACLSHSRALIGLAIMVYETLYHALQIWQLYAYVQN